jgi:hypothetical protein
MQLAFDHTDWAVLSHLLRGAQREGWRVTFDAKGIELACPRATATLVVLPATLLRQARAGGWQVSREGPRPTVLALRHPSVRQPVSLRLGA